jgi:diguanylate cyclase (GGDEF)-like protein/PAS domain S-box-containing protein
MKKQAQANLVSLIDHSEEFFWSVDLERRLLTFNRAFRQHLEVSYGVGVAVGSRLEELLPAERGALWLACLETAMSSDSSQTEYSLLDGRTLELSFRRIAAHGETTGMSVFGKDITDRKIAEKAVEETEKKYRDIFDGSLEGLFQTTLEGKALAANSAFAKMLGYGSPDEAVSTITDTATYLWVDPAAHATFKQELAEHGTIREFECQFKRKSGTRIWVSLNCRTVWGSDGRALFNQGFLQDITHRRQAELRLRDSEERYRSTFEQAAVGIVHTSMDGQFLRCNARFAETIGYLPEEIPGLTFQKITAPDALGNSVGVLQKLLSGEIANAIWEKQYIRKDGSLVWVRVTVSIQRDCEGCALHFIAVIEDINSLKETEQLLEAASKATRRSEECYRTAFQNSFDAVTINRLSDGAYVEVNKSFLDDTGYERDEVIGRTSLELGIWADPSDRAKLHSVLSVKSICRNLETRFIRKNGEQIWAVMSASVIEIDGAPCVFSITRNISDAKIAEEKIRSLAYYDSLTNLPNRRLLMDRLGLAATTGARHRHKRALLFVDLDNFKALNDTLGHYMGDLLLQGVARRITSCVREAGMVARLGGDEFVVALENLSANSEDAAAQAKSVAERILATISRPHLLDGQEWRNTASIGIAVVGDRRETTDVVLQHADIAMYQAKIAGRNTIRFFAPALQAAVNARAEMEADLRRAISEREFLLYYQPQMDGGCLVGAEALIRWNHPRRGVLSPSEFIPLAEETGLILPIGAWVLETACAQLAAWATQERTSEITIAVNVSARQFGQLTFVEDVLALLEKSGANPKRLKLELTESMLVHNFEDVVTKMTALKAHGLRFALDDFGTGYSSLSYLKRLPLDQLKIDQSFIRDLLVDANSSVIAQTIISLSQAMGLSVIAEGVETEEQLELLAHLECHSFQGYLFSPPVTLANFERMLPSLSDITKLIPMRGAPKAEVGEPLLAAGAN